MKCASIGLLCALTLGSVAGAGETTDSPAPAVLPAASRSTPPAYAVLPELERPVGLGDHEALVYVRLRIDAAGAISQATVIDRGFGHKAFRNAALASLKRARFRPATVDGKAVPAVVLAPFAFKLGLSQMGTRQWMDGIRSEFDFELNKVEKLLTSKDYDGALQIAERLERNLVKYAYEYALLKAHLAEALSKNGRDTDALRAATAATLRTTSSFRTPALHEPVPANSASNYLLPGQLIVQLLEMRMQLSFDNGLLLDALDAYFELAGLVTLAEDDPLVVAANHIVEKLEGNEPLTVRARIDSGAWSGRLFRRNFTLRNVRGTVESLALECGISTRELRYAPGQEWTIPAGWSDCSVSIKGKPGTSFEFVELAN